MDPVGYGKNNKNKVYLLHMFRQTIYEASQASFWYKHIIHVHMNVHLFI